MRTKPGSIYFLKERDYLTGAISPYVKIGLVRDDKPTEKRISEHQTGNPREILDYATLPMRFVEDAETRLHYLFGEQWIAGEWFSLSNDQLQEALDICSRINEEQIKIADSYLHSIELKDQISTKDTLSPSAEEIQLHEEAIQLKNQLKVIDGKLGLCKNRIMSHLGNGIRIDGILDTIIKDGTSSWSEKNFKQDHPSIYESYLENDNSKVSGSFILSGQTSLRKLDDGLDAQIKASKVESLNFEEIDSELTVERTNKLAVLHLEYIQLNKEKYQLDWEYRQKEYQIQSRMGIYAEFEGIAKWKRELKDSFKLNKEALFAAHPEFIEQYQISKPKSVSYQVRNWRSYPF